MKSLSIVLLVIQFSSPPLAETGPENRSAAARE